MTITKSRQRVIAYIIVLGLIFFQLFAAVKTGVINALFYTEVEAQVVSMSSLCRVYGATPEAQTEVDKSPVWRNGAWDNCEVAAGYIKDGTSRYHQMKLINQLPALVVTLDYTSPADGSLRTAKLRAPLSMQAGVQKRYVAGTMTKMLAHKSKPEKAKPYLEYGLLLDM